MPPNAAEITLISAPKSGQLMRHRFAAYPLANSVSWYQERRQIAQVGEFNIGHRMTLAERALVAIDPDRPDSSVARAGNVAIQTVTYHHCFVRRDFSRRNAN